MTEAPNYELIKRVQKTGRIVAALRGSKGGTVEEWSTAAGIAPEDLIRLELGVATELPERHILAGWANRWDISPADKVDLQIAAGNIPDIGTGGLINLPRPVLMGAMAELFYSGKKVSLAEKIGNKWKMLKTVLLDEVLKRRR